jgi:hypothetical protein
MAIVTKTTLKTYFEQGDIPTQGQYVDLIDSNLNLGESETTQIIQGTISASAAIVGYIELKKMYIPGIGVGSATVGTTFIVGRSLEVIGDINTTGNISASGYLVVQNITASSNISASGYLVVQNITASSNISSSGHLIAQNITASANISASGYLVVQNITASSNISASGTGSFGFLALANISTSGYLVAQNITASGNISASGDIITTKLRDSVGNNHIVFGNNNNTIAISSDDGEIMTLDGDSQRVGINKTTPGEALEVVGNISASGNLQGVNFHAFNAITRVGVDAGSGNTGTLQTAVGATAGSGNTGNQQTAIGNTAGYNNTSNAQTAIGNTAGYNNTGNAQTAIGFWAGYNNSGASSIAIGSSGQSNSGDNLVAIGTGAGNSNTLDNQFIVLQSGASATPLIQGNFQSGSIGIGLALPQANLHVSGNIWASGSNGNITASGNISASGTITATSFTGSLQGTASIATKVTVATTATNATHYLTFTDATTGNKNVRTSTTLTYNPFSNTLGASSYQYNNPDILTAAGSNQATATPIIRSGPVFVTGVTGRGILLPSWSETVYILTIHNMSLTDSFLLYPFSGESIGTLGSNAPATVPAGGSIILTSGGPALKIWQGYLGNVIT